MGQSPYESFPNKFSSSNRGRADQANDTDEWRTSKPTSGVMARGQPAFVHDPNAWRPSKATDEHQVAIKKVKGILNKLTRDNYEKLCVEMSNIIFPSLQAYEEMVSLIFVKALSESLFVVIYAELCGALSKNSHKVVNHFAHVVEKEGSFYWTKNKDESASDSLSEPFPTQEQAQENMKSEANFRKILLSRCQMEFESENNLSDVDAKIQETKGELSTCKDDVGSSQAAELNAKVEELIIARTKIKSKMLGNIKFIGELYKQKLIAEKVIHQCVHTLLKDGTDPDEEDIECLCELLQVVGSLLDAASINTKKNMDEYFVTLNTLSQNKELNSRLRFMIKDVIDLRKDSWKARTEQLQVKTNEQIHQDVAREEIEILIVGRKGQQNFGMGGYQSNQYQGGQKGNMGPMFGKAAFVSNQKTQSQNSQDFRMAGKDLQNAASASGKAGEVSLRPSFGSSRGNRNYPSVVS